MLVGFISRFVRHFFVSRPRTRRKSLRLHNDSREIFSYYAFTHEIAYFLQKRYLSEREREKDSEGERENEGNEALVIFGSWLIRPTVAPCHPRRRSLYILTGWRAAIRDGQNLNRDRERHAAHKAHGINQKALLSYRSSHHHHYHHHQHLLLLFLLRSRRFFPLCPPTPYPSAIRYHSSTRPVLTVTSESPRQVIMSGRPLILRGISVKY